MAFKYILVILFTISLGSTEERKRLIKYDINDPAKWMTLVEMDQLVVKTDGFVDLTREGVDTTMMTEAEGRQQVDHKYPDHPSQKEMVVKLLSSLQKDHLKATIRKLSSFHSRNAIYYYGESEAEGWLVSEIKRKLIDYKGGPDSISFHFVDDSQWETDTVHSRYNQNNIILKLQGRDPTLLKELIILGAHYDSIYGLTPSQQINFGLEKAPGADDNASGCAVLLESLGLLVESGILLKHTVEFHFYTANEMGKIGSEDVVTKYQKEEKLKVNGMLNFDKAGYGNTIAIVDTKFTNGPLSAFVNMLAKEYTEGVQIESGPCKADHNCFSDQYSWHVKGYPAAYIFETPQSPFIHLPNDTIENINFKLVNEFTKVAVAFVIELGEPIFPSASAAKPGLERMNIFYFWCGLLYFFH